MGGGRRFVGVALSALMLAGLAWGLASRTARGRQYAPPNDLTAGPAGAQVDGQADGQPADDQAADGQAVVAEDAAAQLAADLAAEAKNPAVSAVLSLRPTTPEELLRSVITLYDLRARATARQMFQSLLATPLDQEQRADLAKQVGEADVLHLMRARELGPDAAPLASSLIEAAAERARDPARLRRLADELAAPDAAVRVAAMSDLMEAQTDGAVFCLGELADPERAPIHADLATVIVNLGAVAEGPVLAATSTADEAFRARVFSLAGRMRLHKATPLLLGPSLGSAESATTRAARQALTEIYGRVLSANEAEAYLQGAIGEALAGKHPYWPDYRGMVEMWQWNDATRTATRHEIAIGDAGVILAERMTRDFVTAWPERPEHHLFHAALLLQLAKMQGGFDQPLSREPGSTGRIVSSLGSVQIARILDSALAHDLVGGAAAACELLAEANPAELGADRAEVIGSLSVALEHGDRRLKFAALTAILRLAPAEPFPGAGLAPGALDYFANTGGALVALAAHPRVERAVQMSGLFEQLGYHAQIGTRGRDVIEMAQASADVSLALIDIRVNDPGPREILRVLRRGNRTSRLPVGLVVSVDAPPEQWDAAERLAADDPLTTVVRPPLETSDAEAIEATLQKLVGRGVISRQERLAQAATALDQIRQLVDRPNPLLDVRSQFPTVVEMIHLPELQSRVLALLAVSNFPAGQRALVDAASDPFVDIAGRQAAGAAFRLSVARFGVLLKRDEMLRQYDRYNGADSANVEAKMVLSSILDTLEGRDTSRPDGL